MLTDWLIFLDLLEENNCNTSFLRLITPIIFGIFKCHYYNYRHGNGLVNGYGFGDGFGNGDGYGSGYNYSFWNISSYDEEH